jgi:L-cysteine S-thiosulfotransferase
MLCAGILGVQAPPALASSFATYRIDGDTIAAALTKQPGDPARGRAIVVDRQRGLCLLCHTGPFAEEKTPGNISTDLAGVGARWNEGQLRLRIVDARHLNPNSLMPSMHARSQGARVAQAFRNEPVLKAQEVEDVIAFLKTLQ